MSGTMIYLVDDDEAVRDGLSLLLSTYGMTVETFADPTTFLAHIDEHRPGILLLDLRMPLISGLQVQQKLTERRINWPVIMITGHGDVNACRRAFKAGISDFLSKPIDEDVLLDAIHSAQTLLQTRLEKQEAVDLLASLTSREREVFDLVCEGFASKDIAAALDISARTIDAHRANIAEKLKTSSVAEFVRLTIAASQ
ncbi:response regulator [Brucella pseudogrignonensis]|uniref:Flagellar transcriptional regulator FtcR n=1 Tax=Brucella pseudogrignonensis TaxID=419475 RepID=A0ABU1MEF3_9HYPH|nr:response regulator [Brucella pseudogrignonensis]MDR6434146.1 FixJ family two-component response regulator [Brucella pseudogrignonensis]